MSDRIAASAFGIDRFDEMTVKSGSAAQAVSSLSIAGHRDQHTACGFRLRTQTLCERIAVHVRQADIEQADIRRLQARPCQSRH